MQTKHVVLLLIFMVTSTILFAQKKKPQTLPFQKFMYKSKGDTLPYAILSPATTSKTEKYPLVIFLHGKSERGKDNETHLQHLQILFNQKSFDKFRCFVFAPQCPKKYFWSDLISNKKLTSTPTPALRMVIETMNKIIKDYPIDTTRIYVTGVSMGGFATWELITRFPERFAAAVPVCGGGDASAVQKIKNIPIWAFHGAQDSLVPPARSRAMVYALQAAGSLPGYTEYPDAQHNSWVYAYKEPHLLQWVFKQKKK
jgi:predicted peptidase